MYHNDEHLSCTSFSSTPAQMVRQATASIELLATFRVFRTLFSCNASPSAIPVEAGVIIQYKIKYEAINRSCIMTLLCKKPLCVTADQMPITLEKVGNTVHRNTIGYHRKPIHILEVINNKRIHSKTCTHPLRCPAS